jgi:hypothetical protein
VIQPSEIITRITISLPPSACLSASNPFPLPLLLLRKDLAKNRLPMRLASRLSPGSVSLSLPAIRSISWLTSSIQYCKASTVGLARSIRTDGTSIFNTRVGRTGAEGTGIGRLMVKRGHRGCIDTLGSEKLTFPLVPSREESSANIRGPSERTALALLSVIKEQETSIRSHRAESKAGRELAVTAGPSPGANRVPCRSLSVGLMENRRSCISNTSEPERGKWWDGGGHRICTRIMDRLRPKSVCSSFPVHWRCIHRFERIHHRINLTRTSLLLRLGLFVAQP